MSYISSDRWPIQDFSDCSCSWGYAAVDAECISPDDTVVENIFNVEFAEDIDCGQVLTEASSLLNAVRGAASPASLAFVVDSSCEDPTELTQRQLSDGDGKRRCFDKCKRIIDAGEQVACEEECNKAATVSTRSHVYASTFLRIATTAVKSSTELSTGDVASMLISSGFQLSNVALEESAEEENSSPEKSNSNATFVWGLVGGIVGVSGLLLLGVFLVRRNRIVARDQMKGGDAYTRKSFNEETDQDFCTNPVQSAV
jgi:hypothetical protein